MLRTGQPTLGYTVAGVQIGPMGSNLQPSGLGGDEGVFVGLRGSQRAGRIQLHQIIFEHTFNIRRTADTLPGHSEASRRQTTPHRYRQHLRLRLLSTWT
jgi:hypothetical protein